MKKLSIFTILVCLLLPYQALADSKDVYYNDQIRAQLTMINMHGAMPTKGALEVKLQPGWHTYWRASGDSGLPPVLSWDESENIKDVVVHWPVPKRKEEQGFNVFAYERVMTLPLLIMLEDPTKEATLKLDAQIMICKDICIPQKFSLKVPFVVKKREMEELRTYYTILPKGDQLDTVKIGSVVASKDKLVINVAGDNGFEGLDIFPVIEDEMIGLAAPPVIDLIEDNPNQAMVSIPVTADIENLAEYLKGKTLSLTILHDGNAAEHKVSY